MVTRKEQSKVNPVKKAWQALSSRTRFAFTGSLHPDLSPEDEKYVKRKMEECILGNRGEISDKAGAAELGMAYLQLSPAGKKKFLSMLAAGFDTDPQTIDKHLETISDSKDGAERIAAEIALRRALVPPRVKLLKLFNRLPDGFTFLIGMREDLLACKGGDPYLRKLDTDLKDLLASWFDISLLDLKEITWDSPAVLLEKLIAYEAVHEIRTWTDLKHRLQSDRRCFAFFHNKMPEVPLIFVEVALTHGMADNISRLLDVSSDTLPSEKADTAVFYSISSTQKGLAGISMGNFLIKQVVEKLLSERKNIRQFATLSPIPGFTEWLREEWAAGDTAVLGKKEAAALKKIAGDAGLVRFLKKPWHDKAPAGLKMILLKLGAHYLVHARRGSRAYDPVAHFHLTNGARVERLNWLADTSEKGLRQSAGMMVNYRYRLSGIDANHERYVTRRMVTCSRGVRGYLDE